ncbi:chondroitinase family polysaccharide lyase [Flavicella sediminum]|uniref:chondroitinase family polysaccharide lyase n=1 Tax=Flavicella sediminum TaxID=2585141 RepID=UPI00111FCCF1|nr:chondroitinase family polysaccharide lyase [Flavicella sediminum]
MANPYKKLFLLCFALSFSVYSQEKTKPAVESFEEQEVLTSYKTSGHSELAISSTHYKYGSHALQWTWKNAASFSTSNFRQLSLKESPLKYGDHFPASPTLSFAIYNEKSQNEKIKISATTVNDKEVWFEIDLAFTGWRTLWIPYYEMQGAAPKKQADIQLKSFEISTQSASGNLFFDDIVFSQYQDDRHSYPDTLVPFIKKDLTPGADHWMPLMQNLKYLTNIRIFPISPEEKKDLAKIEKRLDAATAISKKPKENIEGIVHNFEQLKIKRKNKVVLGPPMDFKSSQIYFNKKQQGVDNHNEIEQLGSVLKQIALNYPNANKVNKETLKRMAVLGTEYFLDQGWQAGSSGGTRHHIGYNVRELAEAFFILRDLLKEEKLLNQVGESLHWLFNLGMVLGDESKFHVNIDYLNTQAYYHLTLLFLVEEPAKQAAILRAYKNYISITLAQQKQEWGFKVDGTAWHHNGHYPAYGMGAFRNVPKIIHTLSGTKFRIEKAGHENFKNAFLATRLYSQKLDYGFGNAGRHPLEDNSIGSLKKQYLQMANSGSPDGSQKIDKEVAAAYLRLWGKSDSKNRKLFTETHGIQEEKLSVYSSFPYAATAVHRRNNWAAIIKGYSKYVWSSEIYVASNRYGRYPANGTIQLLNEKGEAASGFKQNGWDWNRYPGATVIYLPFEELEPNTPLLMYRSSETFAGAVALNDNGVFGMILNESKGSNADGEEAKIGFPGKLKAKKSVFSFGDKLICIGTNISSIDNINPTQTSLFQNALRSSNTPIYTSKKGMITGLSKTGSSKKWLIDAYKNGYHILSKAKTNYSRKKQKSYHNKYSIKTGAMNPKGKGAKETEGNFASAWIDHGIAPKNASYQYVIYPFLKNEEIKKFGKLVKKDTSFKIQRADSIAHIVKDLKTNSTGLVIFEATKELNNEWVKEVSAPCLILFSKKKKNTILLHITEPNLNFKEYKTNKFLNYSNPVNLKICIQGIWNIKKENKNRKLQHKNDKTLIDITCIDGATNSLELIK